MQLSLRAKLIVSFVLVVLVSGIVSIVVGTRLIGDRIIKQAQDKVRTDLNSAREIYREAMKDVLNTVRFQASRTLLRQAVIRRDRKYLMNILNQVLTSEPVDILDVIAPDGSVILRIQSPDCFGDNIKNNKLIDWVIRNKRPISSTLIIPESELRRDGSKLAEQAKITILPTPKAKVQRTGDERSGMMIAGVAPIFDEGQQFIGIIYGGKLLNRNYDIVDKIKNTVFQDEKYKGKDVGTATIFQGDLRISTNVTNLDGSRAIGTLVSKEVYEAVLERGIPWIARAFVVHDWYITSYEPIRDIDDSIIGILYVGILEQKFTDLRNSVVLTFLLITMLGIAFAVGLSFLLASGIVRPLQRLTTVAQKIAGGDFSQKVTISSKDEIGNLCSVFNFMVSSIQERDLKLKEFAQAKIAEAERLALIGQLAAGVAHELNNPLSGIVLYSHMLIEKMNADDPRRESLEKIVKESQRCRNIVKGLLYFARQTEPQIKPSSINKIIEDVLSLLGGQTIFLNIKVNKFFNPDLPPVNVDESQIQQVFINIIMNAVEAMNYRGELTITTNFTEDKKNIFISFADTGCGIAKENLSKIFDPFFTTKEVGHGTGLGLSISYGIIEKHQGKIKVESELGKGSTFTVELPVT